MDVSHYLKDKLDRLRHGVSIPARSSAVLGIGLAVAIGSIGMAAAAAHAQSAVRRGDWAGFSAGSAPEHLTVTQRLVWQGADLDGDGRADIANPTGHAPRGEDAYGEGRFHATRDGGEREHAGVDYVATAGQAIEAPISGYVSKIGFAYPDDQTLRYVEIDNPALHLTARVFYVDPAVGVGDAVAVGHPIGQAHSLQRRYPRGITDHVHLELDESGRKVDAARLIVARNETVTTVAAD
jgi:murein DD-endopeptidase MepM/ murein hydrolase activator NlpD